MPPIHPTSIVTIVVQDKLRIDWGFVLLFVL